MKDAGSGGGVMGLLHHGMRIWGIPDGLNGRSTLCKCALLVRACWGMGLLKTRADVTVPSLGLLFPGASCTSLSTLPPLSRIPPPPCRPSSSTLNTCCASSPSTNSLPPCYASTQRMCNHYDAWNMFSQSRWRGTFEFDRA